MGRIKQSMTLSFSAETKERLRLFAEQNHKTVSQAITDWIWSQKVRDPESPNGHMLKNTETHTRPYQTAVPPRRHG